MDKLYVISPGYEKAEPVDSAVILDLKQYMGWHCDKYIVQDEPACGWNADTIPVGNLVFVAKAMSAVLGTPACVKPIEIPDSLLSFCRREYKKMPGSKIIGAEYADASKYFIKDISELKSWNSLLQIGDVSAQIDPDRMYSVSTKLNFGAEYRIFVCRESILGIQRYVGDPLIFPDAETVRAMIKAYDAEEHPRSYTLDIGITDNGTVPIEVHNFCSCGLYGLYDRDILIMLQDGWDWNLSHPGKVS